MFNLFDTYERKAHLFPALIITSPLLLLALAFEIASGFEVWRVASESVVFVPLIALVGVSIRQRGRRIERMIWAEWGGAPSTRYMRWRDDRFSFEFKLRLHQAVRAISGLALPTPEEEREEPTNADRLYEEAFRHVRILLRNRNQQGPAAHHNADYGFARNLLAGAWAWTFFGLGATAGCVLLLFVTSSRNAALLLITFTCVAESLASLVCRATIRQALKDNSERYAEAALIEFVQLFEKRAG